ncbi:metalloprotease [Halorussus salilacus]|uniref:metalloprotease n=1 Tax=Halorussus salilacus TaxID=2953750 RepID=UPI00209D893A|nr:metalloprotease [Halorussus salilacus]USZ67928.1 metalloprotease [Halorussus salilacus]
MSANIRFSGKEIQDLLVAWAALGVAFAFFLNRRLVEQLLGTPNAVDPTEFAGVFGLSLVTAGVGFLLHELAHKVVAIRFGQVAEFRADYGMLFLAVAGGMAGFLFAAPGAVYHRGRITPRENGLIALAGPLTNVALGLLFLPLAFAGSFVGEIGHLGVVINFLLAGFNMIPFGPLDGATVKDWSLGAFAGFGIPCFALAAWALFLF